MPCYDPDSQRNYAFEDAQQAKIDDLTRLLCYACGQLEANAPNSLNGDSDIAKWWAVHKQWDEQRNGKA